MGRIGIAGRRLALALLALGVGGAEALTYSWKPSTTAYTPVTTGTPLTFLTPDNGSVVLSLPFTFTYDSVSYASVGVNTNGMLVMGAVTNTSAANGDLFISSAPYNVLAPWWDDMIDDATSVVQSSTEGTAPNRVFVIQYGDYPDYANGSTPLRLNWQVRLYEGSNRIQFLYGSKNGGASNFSSSASVGIKGQNGLAGFYFEGTMGSRSVPNAFLNSGTGFPAAGTAFTFAPDTAAPLGLTATARSAGANLTWRRTRQTSLLRYRIWAGTSPTSMVPRDSTAILTDTTRSLAGLTNGVTYYIGVTELGPGSVESGFAQVVAVTPTQPPMVSITAPAQGSVVTSNAGIITLTANATDPDGSVTQVDYYRGTVLVGTSFAGNPFTVNATAVSGPWSLTARATDNLGAVTVSAPVAFTVNLAPTVNLTSPFAGTFALGTTFTLTASASDGDGSVSKVEFFHEGTKIGEDATDPYSLPWTPDTTGRYALTVRATDNSGAVTTSATVFVTLERAPTVHFSRPLNGGVLNYPLDTLEATATDSDGTVSEVYFYNGPTYIGAAYGSPYRIPWTLTSRGPFTLIAIAYDNLGLASKPDTIVVSSYLPPQVSLTAPANFSAFAPGSTIALSAAVVAGTRPVSQVRYYRDSILIGTAASGLPFGLNWSNVPAGRYRLQARALDDHDSVGYSQAVTVFVNDSAKAVPGGRLFITGHDADDHQNYEFISAAIDYLLFGKAAGSQDLPIKKGVRIGYLANLPYTWVPVLAYGTPTYINVTQAGWDTVAFSTRQPFDVLIVGTGEDYLSSTGSAAVNAQRAKFDAYFNRGGGILALSEQGLGQSYYNFLPAFGSAQQQSIGSVSGVFTATPAGLAIGLTEPIVDRDLTHTEFLNVDTTLFRTFEFYNVDQKPVSIGINAVIGGNIFIPQDSVVAPPEAVSRDSVFNDTLCIRFQSPTLGAILHLTTDGGNPDTSSWTLANGSQLCIDNSTRFRVIAKKPGWVTSAEKEFRYRRADQVAIPVPDIPAGYFPNQVCVRFTSATPGALIRYTLDGGRPDTSGLSKANGDSVCLDASRVIRVLGQKTGMRDSDTSSYAYTRMAKVAMPTLDKPDSTWFSSSLCFKFSSTTPGSQIHYSLDGGNPDTVETFVHNGDSLCIDRSLTVRLVAKAANSVTSDENRYHYLHMETLARPAASVPDSTGFSGSLCVRFSTNADGAALRYTLDGSDPAVSALTMPMSDSLCLDRTVTVRARAEKTNWIPSSEADFTYRLMPRVERPTASRIDSSWFADTLCVRFATATDSATLHYLLGPGRADTSSLVIPQGQNLCVDRNTVVRVAGTRPGWLPSPELPLRFYKMDTAAAPTADPGDSTWFAGRQCIRLSSATAGASIWYTTDGGDPSASTHALANGDSLCVEDTATVRALARERDWVDSRVVAFHYIRMPKAATPTADKPDSTYFPEQVCVRLQSASEGVRIRYSLDGGRADTSGLSIANGDTLCVDRSVRIQAVAVGGKWSPSDELGLNVIRMGTLPSPEARVPDSTWFRDSLCVPWTTSIAGAAITVRSSFLADGKSAASDSATKTLVSGDSVCFDRSATLRAVASLKNWKDSPEAVRSYFRMDTVADPVFGTRDTVFYPSYCVEVSSSTPGADIRYTVDGGEPDTSRLVKHSSDTICVDRSTRIRAVAERKNSIPSRESVLRLEKMPQVAPLVSSIGDSAVFAHRLCFTLSSATDSVRIRYTLGGGNPLDDTLSMDAGGTVCVEHSAEVVAIGTRPLWRNSPEVRISLEADNDGPRVTKAEKHPFDIRNLSVTGNCRGIGQDTLKVAFSERLFPKSNPPQWDRMLLFSPSCESGDGLPVKPAGDPVISSDGLEATILLDNASSDEKPKLGNCLSLDWRSGEFPDRVGNPPERHGVRIEGSENTGSISEIRAYPPVVGLENARAAGNGCRDEGVHENTWIPPVGFDPVSGTINPDQVRSCPSGGEATGRSSIPKCMSIVEVVSDGPYVADVRIFDQLGNFVHASRQQFGACGELDNLERSVDGKKRSYLVWNTRDRAGARAGNGVYVWRIAFEAEKNGVQGVHTVMIKTGFIRTGACSD